MSNKNNTKSDASQEEIIVRLFERGDSEGIMDVDFSMKGVRIYKWLDGKLVKGKEYYDDEDFSSEEKKEIVEKFGPYPSGRDWVKCGAFAGDVMVGFLVMFLYPSEQHMWGISYCFVSRKYQRQGIATRMFALAKTTVLEAGARKICFMSAINKSAVDFYLSVGFAPFEKPPEDERWSGWDGEDIYMEMML